MPCTLFLMRSCVCHVSLSQKQTFLEVSQAQNHRFVGNDLNAFFSFLLARASGVSRKTAIPARDPTSYDVDREQEIASTVAVQARLAARERVWKYVTMYMTPNTIA